MAVVSQSSVKFGKKRVFLVGTINFIVIIIILWLLQYSSNCIGNTNTMTTESILVMLSPQITPSSCHRSVKLLLRAKETKWMKMQYKFNANPENLT